MAFRPCLYLAMLSRIPASLHYVPPHTHTHTLYRRLLPHLTLSIPLCVSCSLCLSSLSALILPANFHSLFKPQHSPPVLSEAFLPSILPQAEHNSGVGGTGSYDLCIPGPVPPNPQADAADKDIWDLPWVSLGGRVLARRRR